MVSFCIGVYISFVIRLQTFPIWSTWHRGNTFLPCGGLDFESPVIVRNDEFKCSFHTQVGFDLPFRNAGHIDKFYIDVRSSILDGLRAQSNWCLQTLTLTLSLLGSQAGSREIWILFSDCGCPKGSAHSVPPVFPASCAEDGSCYCPSVPGKSEMVFITGKGCTEQSMFGCNSLEVWLQNNWASPCHAGWAPECGRPVFKFSDSHYERLCVSNWRSRSVEEENAWITLVW